MVIGRVVPAPAGLRAPVIQTMRSPEARVVKLVEAARRWARLRNSTTKMTPELMAATAVLTDAARAFDD